MMKGFVRGQLVEKVKDEREVVEEIMEKVVGGGEEVVVVVEVGHCGQRIGDRKRVSVTATGQRNGRSAEKGRGGRRAEPSSLPWQPVDVDPGKDTIPSPVSFNEDVGSILQMPPGSQPVDYYR